MRNLQYPLTYIVLGMGVFFTAFILVKTEPDNSEGLCPVKIQGVLVGGQKELMISGDLFIGNQSSQGAYSIEILDITNGLLIATGVPMQAIPKNLNMEHRCTNGNEGLAIIDLSATTNYFINATYSDGLPNNIIVVVRHENGTEDSAFVISEISATETASAYTPTPLSTNIPAPTPTLTSTPLPTLSATNTPTPPMTDTPQATPSPTTDPSEPIDQSSTYLYLPAVMQH